MRLAPLLEGPGVVFQLEDSVKPTAPGSNEDDYRVSARDIRTVVEELWLAGADAVSVNGERLTVSTAILDIGPSVLVNSAFLGQPYQVSAVGPGDLYERVSASQGFADFLRARSETYGIQVSFFKPAPVAVPAFAGTVTLRFAKPAASSAP